jgi:hypothetical protein
LASGRAPHPTVAHPRSTDLPRGRQRHKTANIASIIALVASPVPGSGPCGRQGPRLGVPALSEILSPPPPLPSHNTTASNHNIKPLIRLRPLPPTHRPQAARPAPRAVAPPAACTMSDVFEATSMASLWEALKSATPMETAIVATIVASLFMVYTMLTRCDGISRCVRGERGGGRRGRPGGWLAGLGVSRLPSARRGRLSRRSRGCRRSQA